MGGPPSEPLPIRVEALLTNQQDPYWQRAEGTALRCGKVKANPGLPDPATETTYPAPWSPVVIIWSESLHVLLFPYDDYSIHCT